MGRRKNNPQQDATVREKDRTWVARCSLCVLRLIGWRSRQQTNKQANNQKKKNIRAELLSKRISRAIKDFHALKQGGCSPFDFQLWVQNSTATLLIFRLRLPFHQCHGSTALPQCRRSSSHRKSIQTHKSHLLCETYFCPPVLIVYHKLSCSQWFDIKLIFNSSLASSLENPLFLL